MITAIFSLGLMFGGVILENFDLFIAAGLFAIASAIESK